MKKLLLFLLLALPAFGQTNYTRMLSGVNYQSGTSYAFVPADATRVTSFKNAAPVAVTLLSGLTANFGAGTVFSVNNLGAGTVTVTCSGCTINGSGTFPLLNGQGADIYGDGLNYVAIAGTGGASIPTPLAGSLCFLSTGNVAGDWLWGTCPGGGGGGNVYTAPPSNQNIVQPAGTQTSVNNFAGVRYITLSPGTFNWSQAVTASITGGVQATVTLTPVPLGIVGTDTTSYISINSSAEYVQLQGGGTAVPGAASGTIKFTTVSSYTNPTLGSASSGIQEGIIDAEYSPATGLIRGNLHIVFQPTNPPQTTYYTINRAVTIAGGIGDIDGSGASLDCEAPDACFKLPTNSGEAVIHGFRVATKTTMAGAAITNTVCASNVSTITTTLNPAVNSWVDIKWTDSPHYWGIHQVATTSGSSFTYADTCTSIASAATPGMVAPEHAFVEDSGQGWVFRDIVFDAPAWASGVMNSWFVVLTDQGFIADNIQNGSQGLQCTANYCGFAFYGPGGGFNFSIMTLTHLDLGLGCAGNGIMQMGGGGLTVKDFSVIQGFAQYSIVSGRLRGGFAQTMTDGVYNEIGGCSNPIMTAAGFTGAAAYNMAGIEQLGGGVVQVTDTAQGNSPGVGGEEPVFATGGGTAYEYWLVICDGTNCSMPMRFGQASPPNSSAYQIGWPRYASQTGSTVTYWPLRAPAPGGAPNPAPYGTGNWSLVSSAVAQCSGYICTMNDSTSTSMQSYTVNANPALQPTVWNWPGGVVLGGGASLYSTAGLPYGPLSGIVPTSQNQPSVFAQNCDNNAPGIWTSCLNVGVTTPGGTILQNGPTAAAQTSGVKGRLNFAVSRPDLQINTAHVVTINDSCPACTLADQLHRPAYSANDVYIGLDQGAAALNLAQLSFGAPVAISHYIGNTGDNLNYKTRLTANLYAVNVPSVFSNPITLLAPCSGIGCGPYSATGTQVSDNFNRANSGTLGANWTTVDGTCSIVSNQAVLTLGGDTRAFCAYTGSSFIANQVAIVQVPSFGGTSGPCLRLNGGATVETGYCFGGYTGGASVIQKWVAGTASLVVGGGPSPANGDVLQLTVSGTGASVLTATDVTAGWSITGTDSSSPIVSGYPGFNTYNSGATFSNFRAGNLTFGTAFGVSGPNTPGVYEAGVLNAAEMIYTNTQALTAGAATHTFANSFSFTSSATFGCICTDQTAANACKAVPASATTVTLAGTGTDTEWISCSGH